MRIFRYLFKEVASNFFAVSSMLLLIFLSARFVRYLASAASGEFSGNVILSLILFRLPSFLEIILPLSLFLGIMLAYGRLYVESEMVVLQTSGLSKKRLFVYTMGPAVIVMLIVLSCTVYFSPLGFGKYYNLIKSPASTNNFGTLIAGSFRKNDAGNMVIYTEKLTENKTKLHDVFIVRSHDASSGTQLQIIKAKTGELVNKFSGDQYLEFYDGVQITSKLEDLDYTFTRYDTAGILMRKQSSEAKQRYRVDSVSTLSLMDSDSVKERATLHWRLFMPIMIPIIIMIALALSETSHRRGRYIKMLPGIILFFLYYVLLGNARTQAEKGAIPPEIALWVVHFSFFLLALLLLNLSNARRFISRLKNNAILSQKEAIS